MYVIIGLILDIFGLWVLSHFPRLTSVIVIITFILYGYAIGGIPGILIVVGIVALFVLFVIWCAKDSDSKTEQENQKKAEETAAAARTRTERRAMVNRAIQRSREQDK